MIQQAQPKKKTAVGLTLFRVAFTLLAVATVSFIFFNSSENGMISGGKSAAVTDFLNRILEGLGFGIRFTERRVRKLAHFAEYFLLGFLLIHTLRVYTRRYVSHIAWPLFLGVLIPVLDETYQLLIPGRSGQLTDVLIDFAGSLSGIFFGHLLLLAFRGFWAKLQNRDL